MNLRARSIVSTGITLGAFVALLGPAAATAAEFTLSLPVNLQKLHPDITSGRVECGLSGAAAYSSDPAVAVGHGYSASFAIVDRGYQGVVDVPATTLPGYDASAVRSYSCNIEMQANGEWFDLAMDHPVYPMDVSLPHQTIAKGEIR